ncbi:hypothetical protein RCL1_005847 [Eukaryota sp. TZLM3-RCL]
MTDVSDLLSQLKEKREAFLEALEEDPDNEEYSLVLSRLDEKISELEQLTLDNEDVSSPTPSPILEHSSFTPGDRVLVTYEEKLVEAVVIDSATDICTLRLVELGPLIKIPINKIQSHPESRHYKPNDYVYARFSEDKKFYPAVIKEPFDFATECYRVEFLSYKNLEYVKAEFIRPVAREDIPKMERLSLTSSQRKHRAHQEKEVKRKKVEDEFDAFQANKQQSWKKFQQKTFKR